MINSSNVRTVPHPKPNPLRTLLGVMGIALGIIFFLQLANILPFFFDMTNPVYLKIFACYAIISGLVLVINLQNHGYIRY